MDKQAVRTDWGTGALPGRPTRRASSRATSCSSPGSWASTRRPARSSRAGSSSRPGQVMKNLSAILEAESSLDKILMTSIFLIELDDFQPMNEVYAKPHT